MTAEEYSVTTVYVEWFSVGDGWLYEFWPEHDKEMNQQIYAQGMGWV